MTLTNKQRQIANAVVLGHSYAYIGAQLGCAESTIKTQVYNIYNKTGMGNGLELLKFLWAHPEYLGVNPDGDMRFHLDDLSTLSEMPL
jgi:DNA-binding NarL/FixJ family response regulator